MQDGSITPASFTSQRIRDPGVRRLISKITMEENPEYTLRYPQESNVRLEIKGGGGQSHVAQTSYPRGHRNNPMSDEEVEAKFRRLSAEVLSQSQQDRVLELTWQLESLSGLEDLFDALVV